MVVIMSNNIRSLGALIVAITVTALCACEEDVTPPPDCSGVGAIGPASRTVPVNTLVHLEIEIVTHRTREVSWSLESPAGSQAALDSENRPTTSFTPDVPGEYTVSRTVSFYECGVFDHTATITAVEGPVADASATQIFWDVGSTITLDGSASSANVVTWTWTVISRSNQLAGVATPPNGSGETFTFTLDEPNIIEYELTVSDGSLADTTRVTVRSNSPSVSALTPSIGSIGDRVVIDGANFSPTASYLHNKVTFNGVVASFVSGTSASVNQLEVYVPPNATSGPVLVEVPGTGDAGGGRHFEITAVGAWELVHDQGNNFFNGVHVVDSDIATAVGDVIVRTMNGGLSWTEQTTSAVDMVLADVHFVDTDIGYAVGVGRVGGVLGGLVLRTTDGGQQWDVVNGVLREAAGVNPMPGVSVIDASTATVVGNVTGSNLPRILRTTDGGTTWNDQTTDPDVPTSARLSDVYFVNANLGFVVGRNELLITKDPLILRTTDGGGGWTLADVPPALTFTTLYAVSFVDANNGWAVGRGSRDGVTNNAIILHTADGGSSWAEQGEGQVGGLNTLLLDVFFTDVLTGRVVAENLVYRTEDGGTTWIQEFDGLGNIVGGQGVGFTGAPMVGYLVASNPGLIWRRR
jgi:photosystem II stability/assembly factor-like uncharacterized protein